MEDKIVLIESKLSEMNVTLKDGTSIPVSARTTDTYWSSGRKDCLIQILEPLNSESKQEK